MKESVHKWPFVLSSTDEAGLRAEAGLLQAYSEDHRELGDASLASFWATSRPHLDHRAVIVADRRTLDGILGAVARSGAAPGVIRGKLGRAGKLAVMFAGQGSQFVGMGRDLYNTFPVFRSALDQVCAALDRGVDLREVLFAPENSARAARIDDTGFAQPTIFALEVALYRLVESWGLSPDLLLGHSLGQLVAAHVGGVLSLEDACTLVNARARLMQALPGGGAMVALQASEDEVSELLGGPDDPLGVAAMNGSNSVVVSGDEQAVREIAAYFRSLGRKTTRLRVSHAFHSPRIIPMIDEFRGVVRRLVFTPPRIPIVSNLTGLVATADELTSPECWVRHAREAVRFHDGVRTLERCGATAFLELGPSGVLCALARETLSEGDSRGAVVVPTLYENEDEVERLFYAMARLHVGGFAIDWKTVLSSLPPQGGPGPVGASEHDQPIAPSGHE